MIFYGIKIPLSHKLYFMVCALLLCGEIEEEDFNDIPFRRNALKNNKTLMNGNLRKSLYDLKKTIKDTILSDCQHNKNFFNNNLSKTFDENLYKTEFNKFVYSNRDFTLKTLYKKQLQKISTIYLLNMPTIELLKQALKKSLRLIQALNQ